MCPDDTLQARTPDLRHVRRLMLRAPEDVRIPLKPNIYMSFLESSSVSNIPFAVLAAWGPYTISVELWICVLVAPARIVLVKVLWAMESIDQG